MRNYLKPIITAFVVLGASVGIVAWWSSDLVTRTLLGHAESSAQTWQSKLVSSVPDPIHLFSDASLSAEQEKLIEASMAGSDIFRFEAFDRGGYLKFLSDQALFEVEEANTFNATAAAVAQTGEWVITVEDGRLSADRPNHYVEAYMPIFDDSDALLGVMEVYVDVSGLSAALRSKFNLLTMLIVGITSAIYVFPTILLIRRNQQIRERDQAVLSLSRQDALTGLTNRGAFNDAMANIFDDNTEESGAIGILFIDLDRFKEVNDTFGHDVGDQLLKHVADILIANTRAGDLVARLGGDEFVVLCPGIDEKDLEQYAKRLIAQSNQNPLRTGEVKVSAGLSIGTYLASQNDGERRALHRADIALYQAKSNGGGRYESYSSDVELKYIRRRQIADDVKQGLRAGRFFVEYQPIFDQRRDIVGYEALLRLTSQDGQVIPPLEFLPITEDLDMIEELGSWVIQEAVDAIKDFSPDIFVSVNVSPLQLRGRKLLQRLENIVHIQGIDPARICLEITENALLEEHEEIEYQLRKIKALGVQLAIDDFGTGYSSLNYLWRYDFDVLKIDKSFFEAYAVDADRFAKIIETIVSLGRQLGMIITIEGVETAAQLDYIHSTDCDRLQGFLLGRPCRIGPAKSRQNSVDDVSAVA